MAETEKLLQEMTAHVVASYVAHNPLARDALPALIDTVAAGFRSLSQPAADAVPQKPVPAVNPKRTVTRDHIISLEDGRPYKTLRRHLSTRGMTPEEYRAKWGLPGDYPMVAPAYAEMRSEMAKSLGLGRKSASAAPAKRGRPKKT